MFGAGGKSPKVVKVTGKSLPNGKVSFSSGGKPGPAGSGAARNARLQGKGNK